MKLKNSNFENFIKLELHFTGQVFIYLFFLKKIKMPKATQLSEFECEEIIGLRKVNFTHVQIAKILRSCSKHHHQ